MHRVVDERDGDMVRQELMDLRIESWVESQCEKMRNDRVNFRWELPATRAEHRNPKEFSLVPSAICARSPHRFFTGLRKHAQAL